MNRRPVWLVVAGVALAGVLWLAWTTTRPAPTPIETGDTEPETADANSSPGFTDSVQGQARLPTTQRPTAPLSPMAASGQAVPPQQLETEIELVQTVIRNYLHALGENPVGSNAEIAAALRGANPRQVNVLANEPVRLNRIGELLDPWGTPYFFHQLAHDLMQIRSAGPDRQMWTADDHLSGPPAPDIQR